MSSDNQKFAIYGMLLVGAVVISPYTLLRFSFFGMAELIFACAYLRQSNRPIKPEYVFSLFWLAYLSVSLIGFAYNVVFLGHETGTTEGMLFDFSAYLLIFMSCFTMESLIGESRINTYLFLKYVFLSASLCMFGLYLVSLVRPSIFGLSLKYYNYFVPLAANLHQISMFLVPLPFIGIKVFAVEKGRWIRLLILLLIAADIMMAFQAGSTKAYLAIYVGGLVLLCSYVYFSFSKGIFYFVILLIALFTAFNFQLFMLLAIDLFADYDVAGGRAYLYTEAIKVGQNSILFGRGTGQHIWSSDKFWDAHQTFITTFLQTGVVGTFLLVALFYRSLKKQLHNPAILAACTAILVYALGGDVLRRLPIWIFLVLFYNYQISHEPKSTNNATGSGSHGY